MGPRIILGGRVPFDIFAKNFENVKYIAQISHGKQLLFFISVLYLNKFYTPSCYYHCTEGLCTT